MMPYCLQEKHRSRHLVDQRSLSPTPTVGKKPMVAKPIADVKYDGTHH